MKRDRFLLILGEPGGGKSTLVAYILNTYEDTEGRKPIVYPCAAMQKVTWSPTNYNLFEDIMRELGLLEYKRLSNHVLILDGFDEVEVDGSREDLLRHLYICWENASEDYGLKNFSLIITSRRNYLGELSRIEVPYIVLSRFDKDQIIEFCNKYFESKRREDRIKTYDRRNESNGVCVWNSNPSLHDDCIGNRCRRRRIGIGCI